MSEIKALEDMRNTVKTIAADCDEGWILGCLDAIEAEIAERFMELPLDADGVPIHMGDSVEGELLFDNAPNQDQREKIVRCRDCVAYVPFHTYAGMKLDYGVCMRHRRQTDDDRFCRWAERSDR